MKDINLKKLNIMKKKYISPTINVVRMEGLGNILQTSGPNDDWDVNNGGYEPTTDDDMENQRQLGKGHFGDLW